ncbi:MAG: signal peptidase I [Candidatus Methylomirabilis sp.]|nr:signal peptidase I [Deltaproteobacteria bacterium]
MEEAAASDRAEERSGTLREYAEAFIVALLLALFIRTFVVQAFKIPSGSMKDTLLIGDQILVEKFAYGVKIPFVDKVVWRHEDPERDDVIVFIYPEDPSKDFIKRIVGLPGDTVEIRNKQLYVNGEPVTKPYERHVDPGYNRLRDNYGPKVVPPESYLVLGDNRDESHDGRFWGYVPRTSIRGKAMILYWSWDGERNRIRWDRIGKLIR